MLRANEGESLLCQVVRRVKVVDPIEEFLCIGDLTQGDTSVAEREKDFDVVGRTRSQVEVD